MSRRIVTKDCDGNGIWNPTSGQSGPNSASQHLANPVFRFGAESAVIVRVNTFFSDFKYSVRALQRSPGFAVFAILALALGIGANVAVFSAVDAMLLRPMQFRDASRLVEVFEDGSKVGFPHNTPAPANFVDWKRSEERRVGEG